MGTVYFYKQTDMANPGVWYGTITTANSSEISITDYAGRTGTYYGAFTYKNGSVSGGTLTGYMDETDYELSAIALDFKISALKAYQLIQVGGSAQGLYQLALSGSDTLYGSSYADTLLGYGGNDLINGDDGNDNISGGLGNDTINGGADSDEIAGDAGNDFISGGDGNDGISGGLGNDTINGGADSDEIAGDAGNDFISGGDGNDGISGGLGNDTINGDADSDYLAGDAGNDLINGGADVDFISGGAGNDILRGGDDSDVIIGGDGNDVLYGDAGSDYLYGDLGKDILYGGTEVDIFIFGTPLSNANVDTIKDFSIGTDLICLDTLVFPAIPDYEVSSGEFAVVGSTAGLKGNAYLTYCTSNDTLYYDANGIGTGDIAVCKIELLGVLAPSETDFIIGIPS
jgi:Ca2+-binding RTX toxin-like protein